MNREAIKDRTAINPEALPAAPPAAEPATHEFLAELATKPVGQSEKQVLLIKALVPLI